MQKQQTGNEEPQSEASVSDKKEKRTKDLREFLQSEILQAQLDFIENIKNTEILGYYFRLKIYEMFKDKFPNHVDYGTIRESCIGILSAEERFEDDSIIYKVSLFFIIG